MSDGPLLLVIRRPTNRKEWAIAITLFGLPLSLLCTWLTSIHVDVRQTKQDVAVIQAVQGTIESDVSAIKGVLLARPSGLALERATPPEPVGIVKAGNRSP